MPTPSMNACAHVSNNIIFLIRKFIDCKGCVYKYFLENPTRNKCPQCQVELGGKPLETIVKDITLQNIADWLIPDFKQRDDKLKAELLQKMNEKRIQKGKMP